MKNTKLFWRLSGYFLISALFFGFGNTLRAQDTYSRITSAEELTDGIYLIVCEESNVALGDQSGTYRNSISISDVLSNNEISGISVANSANDKTVHEITITKETAGTYTLYDAADELYLCWNSGNAVNTSSNAASWSITFKGNNAEVTFGTNRQLKYNPNNPRFACYTSGQNDIQLYKKQAAPTTPFVNTAKTEVSYKIQPTENLSETLSFTAGNLESDLTVSVASATEGKAAVITLDKTTVGKETTAFDLTLTTSGLAEGEYSDIITLKSGAETMATVTVNLTVELNYPYKKITTKNELTDGGKYLIVCDTKDVALSTKGSGNFQSQVNVTIANGSIEDRGAARELTLIKSGDNWKIYDEDANEYLYYTGSSNELYAGSTENTWKIEFDESGNATITNTTTTNRVIYYNPGSPRFACYTSKGSNSETQLYKKQLPESCKPVSHVESVIKATSVTLTWDAPANAPANGYKVTLTDEEDSEVDVTTVTEPTYTYNNLQAGTLYTYSIVSLCSETSLSEAVEDIFETPSADAKTLSVSLSGKKEGDKYTGPITFTFTTSENFVLGTDGKISYTIIGGVDYDKEGQIEASTLTLDDFSVGAYEAEFELVNRDGESLTPKVSVNKSFAVKLPTVEAPVFSPAEQSAAFTEAQTITLTSETPNASFFYMINAAAEFTAYTDGIELNESGTFTVKAYATKANMDNSDTISQTYRIDLPIEVKGDIVFEEPFDKITTTTNDGSANIASDLDKYTNMPGWSGENVYEGRGGSAKMGTGSKLGYLQTPALDLTADGGKFVLSFDAKAFDNSKEKDNIKLIVNSEEQTVAGLLKDEMKTFVFAFTSGTESTTIRFSAVDASNNRFYLDNIKIYQQLPDEASITAPSTLTMRTVQGTPVSQKVSVKGKLLENDVTVTCPTGNFSVTPATLAKEAVMGENGAEFTVTFNGNELSDNVDITLASGAITKTLKVTATAEAVVEVENLAALRAGTQNTLYKVKGEVVVTAMDTYRNYKWIQDATGAILIDDATGLVTTTYAVGDGITGVYGKLGAYGEQLQLVMTGNLPEASSHNNVVEPELLTIEELTENIEEYCSRLVKINGLTLTEPEGEWMGNTDNYAVNANDESINIRTFVRNGSFVGQEKPQGGFDLIAIAGIYYDAVQVSPRVAEDIITDGRGNDDCEAPTALNVTVDQENLTATATWNSSATNYRVVLLSGTDTVEDATVSNKTYTFANAGTNVEYGWAVASVCEDGKLIWAKGNNFTIQKTGIEDANTLQADVYPNPTDGVVYIRLAENARMEIFTLGGMVLRSEELVAGRNEIRLGQSGIYFIRLSNGSAATVKRVVVR